MSTACRAASRGDLPAPEPPTTPGPWTVFDLDRRTWAPASHFEPVAPLRSAGGWRVVPHRTNAFLWHVIGPGRKRYPLPLHKKPDDRPRCYTFLPAGKGKPVRLA